MRVAVKAHIQAISPRITSEGETAGCALMFLPLRGRVCRNSHGQLSRIVREGFLTRRGLDRINRPPAWDADTKCVRKILKTRRMREQAAGHSQDAQDVARRRKSCGERVGKLNTISGRPVPNLQGLGTAAERAANVAARLDISISKSWVQAG